MEHKNLPIVGIVVTISPNLSLYRIVVLPAASNPTINILISFLPNNPLNRFANTLPMVNYRNVHSLLFLNCSRTVVAVSVCGLVIVASARITHRHTLYTRWGINTYEWKNYIFIKTCIFIFWFLNLEINKILKTDVNR